MKIQNRLWLHFTYITLIITLIYSIFLSIYSYFNNVTFLFIIFLNIFILKAFFFISIYIYNLKNNNQKDSFQAKIAFFLSLFSWIPLFNFGFAPISFFLAYNAYKKYKKYPQKFNGLFYFSFAMVISLTSIILTIVGLVIYLFSEEICTSTICSALEN
ncbi:MAG: hypothetical protein ACLFPJ_05800 [Candidatus Woesearchaeota archaeon]